MGVPRRVTFVRICLILVLLCAGAARVQCQNPESPSILRWVHIDAFWLQVSSEEGGQSSLGLIGTHIALAHLGRVYVYNAPGILLLRDENELGWSLRVHMTWGVSVYLTDIRMPGMRRPAQLFINLANVGGRDNHPGMQMAGFSITMKK